MLVHMGVILIQSGIAEIALAQTLVGRLMGASVAGGIKALAVGALLAAVGGAMEGAASAMTQNSSASSSAASGGSSSTQSSSSSSSPVVYMVGAPKGPQTPGQASGQLKGELTLKIQPPKGWVAQEVIREVGGNNQQLRAVIQNA